MARSIVATSRNLVNFKPLVPTVMLCSPRLFMLFARTYNGSLIGFSSLNPLFRQTARYDVPAGVEIESDDDGWNVVDQDSEDDEPLV